MGRFTEWLKKRDASFTEEATGGPYTVASAQPQVQQAPSPFGGVPPEVTARLQQLGTAGQGVMQRAQQIMQQRPGTNMAQAIQSALGEYQTQQAQGPQPGTPPNQWNQFRQGK